MLGFSKTSILIRIGLEGLLICGIGGAIGCLVSFPISELLGYLIYRAVGFDDIVVIEAEFVYIGLLLTVVMGLASTAVFMAGINRITPMDLLRGV